MLFCCCLLVSQINWHHMIDIKIYERLCHTNIMNCINHIQVHSCPNSSLHFEMKFQQQRLVQHTMPPIVAHSPGIKVPLFYYDFFSFLVFTFFNWAIMNIKKNIFLMAIVCGCKGLQMNCHLDECNCLVQYDWRLWFVQ